MKSDIIAEGYIADNLSNKLTYQKQNEKDYIPLCFYKMSSCLYHSAILNNTCQHPCKYVSYVCGQSNTWKAPQGQHWTKGVSNEVNCISSAFLLTSWLDYCLLKCEERKKSSPFCYYRRKTEYTLLKTNTILLLLVVIKHFRWN